MHHAEVHVRPQLVRPPVDVADLDVVGDDRPPSDQRVVRRPRREAGRGDGVEVVAAGHAAGDGRVLPTEHAAPIRRHRPAVGYVAAEALAGCYAEADVILGRPHRERFDIAADRTAIADPRLIDAPAVIQDRVAQYGADPQMAPGLVEADAQGPGGLAGLRRVEQRRQRRARYVYRRSCGGQSGRSNAVPASGGRHRTGNAADEAAVRALEFAIRLLSRRDDRDPGPRACPGVAQLRDAPPAGAADLAAEVDKLHVGIIIDKAAGRGAEQ